LTINEEKGKFVLFHCNLIHEVKKFKHVKDRVTIAFNFNDVGFIENNNDIKIIK
jgi:ectoine hydroxylase-related dioxygenase (phytanoyl-CoA dioxygenase family)